MIWFVSQSIKKRGRCAALNQFFKSIVSDEAFNIISKELNVNGKIFEIFYEYFGYEKKT